MLTKELKVYSLHLFGDMVEMELVSEEELATLKVMMAPVPTHESDEERFLRKTGEQMVKTMAALRAGGQQVPLPPQTPTQFSLRLTEKEFEQLGSPTVGDTIRITLDLTEVKST